MLLKQLSRNLLGLFFLLMFVEKGVSQVDSEMKKDTIKGISKYLKVTGGINLNTGFYQVFGIENRQDPFQYLLQANLNFTLFDQITAPFSASFSQQQQGFLQPFNRYGISPSYKDLTVHLGYRNVSFSKYTLAGHTFLGVGVEYNHKKLRSGFVYGRFQKELIETNQADNFNGGVAYKRLGYSAKIGYGDSKNFIDFIAFRAKDQENEFNLSNIDSTVTPQENLVLGLALRKQIIKEIYIEGELSQSAISKDIRSETSEAQKAKITNLVGSLFTPRTSSNYNNASYFTINFTPKKINFNIKYERITPNYRTLGAFYFQEDLENITLGCSFNRKKYSFNTSFGAQKNNLNNAKETQNRRLIGSVNLNYNPTKNLNLGLNYSNFSSFITPVRDLNSDSLNFFQVTDNIGGFTTYRLNKTSSLSVNTSLQKAFSRTANTIDEASQTDFFLVNVGFNKTIEKLKLKLSTAWNFNRINSFAAININTGPNLTVIKSLVKERVKLSWNNSYQQTFNDGEAEGDFYSSRLGVNYSINKHHSVGINTSLVRRETQLSKFTETMGFFDYGFRF